MHYFKESKKNVIYFLNDVITAFFHDFGGSIYHIHWYIIREDVVNSAISQFFLQDWIILEINSNVVFFINNYRLVDKLKRF